MQSEYRGINFSNFLCQIEVLKCIFVTQTFKYEYQF